MCTCSRSNDALKASHLEFQWMAQHLSLLRLRQHESYSCKTHITCDRRNATERVFRHSKCHASRQQCDETDFQA